MLERAEVVIVGGGIIGAACADALAEGGVDVLLLERYELAAGASGRNQGLHVMPRDPQLDEMARRSLARYLDVVEELPTPVGLDRRPIGYLLVASDADTPSDPAEGSRWLDGGELRDLEPALAPGLRGAWLADDGYRLDPTSLTVGLALRAQGNGARVRHNLSVRALATSGERVTGVVTDEGVIEAGTVVLTAGPWSPPLARPLGVRIAVNGVRGWLVHLEPGRPLTSRIVEEADLRVWRENVEPPTGGRFLGGQTDLQIGSLITTAPDGSAYLGASRESALRDEPDDPSAPRAIVRRAARLIPGIADARMSSAWWGIRPMTPDERPLIGAVREGLVVATGHGSEGIILAAGTAELVASAVLGRTPPFDPAPFDPFRFD